jgi:hypothetical protein
MRVEHSFKLGIKAISEAKNCGRPGSRKISKRDCAWKPKLGCQWQETHRKMGFWDQYFYKNGALVATFH